MTAIQSVLNDPSRILSVEKRIKQGITITSTGCHEWQGCLSDKGYGKMSAGRGCVFKLHRMAWALEHGDIPEGMCVCHKCDNPKCINPQHLFLGTLKDNTRDMWNKGRESAPPTTYGEQHHNTKFGLQEAAEIKYSTETAEVLAERYRVSTKTIYRIKRGESWKQLP